MGLEAIQADLHAQFPNVRNTNRLIQSDDFAIAYNNASPKERRLITKAAHRIDKVTINKFIKKQLLSLTPFYSMGIKQLREIGKNIRLDEYWCKDKITLIEEIENVVARLKKSG